MTAGPVILGDWGGTRLRLWLRQGGVTVASSEGPGLLAAIETPAQVLRDAIGRLDLATPVRRVVLCGMAGARGGLAETRYVACPGGVDEWVGAALETSLAPFPIVVLPGFSSRDGKGRPDVMRGEEAQVFGALQSLAAGNDVKQTIVLPGTHSKWVELEQGRITHFATCPTGELHALLLDSSLAPRECAGLDPEHASGFSAGVERARDGGALMGSLFEARAAHLLDGRTGDWSRGFLSGLLIGSEIAAMSQRPTRDGSACLVGSPGLVGLYRNAFAKFGLECRAVDGASCAIEGLEIADAKLG